MAQLGLITEDESDCEVIRVLARKIAGHPVKSHRVLAGGSGRMHAKAAGWSRDLVRRGCDVLMLVCDLDLNILEELASSLRRKFNPNGLAKRSIVIPVREIEAWLLSDHDAITQSLALSRPIGHQANPEAVMRPKERLRDLIHQRSGGETIYLNTVHNVRIAAQARVASLRRCRSFRPFEEFVCRYLA